LCQLRRQVARAAQILMSVAHFRVRMTKAVDERQYYGTNCKIYFNYY
jgi:hypothetical protein